MELKWLTGSATIGMVHFHPASYLNCVPCNIPVILVDSQRNEFLHKFLLKLDPRQHYFISSLIAVSVSLYLVKTYSPIHMLLTLIICG